MMKIYSIVFMSLVLFTGIVVADDREERDMHLESETVSGDDSNDQGASGTSAVETGTGDAGNCPDPCTIDIE